MDRRTSLKLLVAAAAAVPAIGGTTSMFRSILESSQNEKKGVMLWVRGQSVPGMVVKIEADHVEMKSREYGRIVVRLDSIDAAAIA
jgi:hypothetical protein